MTRKSGFSDNISQSALHIPRRFRDNRSTSWLLSKGDDTDRNRTRRRASDGRTGKNKPRMFCHMRRSRAAKDAELYYWQYERVDRPLCDVDINKYPYKLVRDGLLAEDELQSETQQYQRMLFQTASSSGSKMGKKTAWYCHKVNINSPILLGVFWNLLIPTTFERRQQLCKAQKS
uniref:Uncharacterized protein n=1 Tax=Hyaloperonospora arabidopsidis (strain Emoy2) TaxID=559515 RepID=M4BD45_HYAAE